MEAKLLFFCCAAGTTAAFCVVSFWLLPLGGWQLQREYVDVRSARTSTTSTNVGNLVFGIGAGAGTWNHRKEYVRLWWRPNETRGIVSLDAAVQDTVQDASLPPPTVVDHKTLSSLFSFRGKQMEDQIRVSRLPSELFRQNLSHVHWFILCDDDTFFVVDNLVKVLSRYDHRELYYIGMFSESHYQSVRGFSTNMAFGGGGIALSYQLVEELSKMQDDCIRRHYSVWGVDGKLQACIAELGVPLTTEKGFHQMDLSGDVIGFLASHPAVPLISLHHLDAVRPIFYGMSRFAALKHFSTAIQADPAAILQQSFCYNPVYNWTLKVAWGYVVQVDRGLISPRILENPLRTFIAWLNCRGDLCFNFRTREVPGDACSRSVNFAMTNVSRDGVYSTYLRSSAEIGCALQDPLAKLEVIYITKEQSQYQAPRRQCCNIVDPHQQKIHELEIKDCESRTFAVRPNPPLRQLPGK